MAWSASSNSQTNFKRRILRVTGIFDVRPCDDQSNSKKIRVRNLKPKGTENRRTGQAYLNLASCLFELIFLWFDRFDATLHCKPTPGFYLDCQILSCNSSINQTWWSLEFQPCSCKPKSRLDVSLRAIWAVFLWFNYKCIIFRFFPIHVV